MYKLLDNVVTIGNGSKKKANRMKKGDFVCVHMADGCSIGKVLEVRNGVIDVEFDDGILMNVPIEVVTSWVTDQVAV